MSILSCFFVILFTKAPIQLVVLIFCFLKPYIRNLLCESVVRLIVFFFQIEVFRTIQDGDGHRLTHNFRPTQPIGDRDVYFVTSMSYPEKDLNQDNQLEDPPQDLDSLGTSTASINPTQHIDQPQMDDSNNEIAFSHNLDHSNELKVETTTPHTRKLFDFSKNDASHSVFRSNWLYIGCSILFAYVFI